MIPKRRFFIALSWLLIVSSTGTALARSSASPVPAAQLTLPRVTISADALAGLPRRDVTIRETTGSTTIYSGVDLGALLAKAGAPSGTSLRGAAVADYAIVTATDGYRALFSLAELDAGLTDAIVLLADKRDGKPLDPKVGPFQIVIPAEKHRSRWVRNVREIDVLAAP